MLRVAHRIWFPHDDCFYGCKESRTRRGVTLFFLPKKCVCVFASLANSLIKQLRSADMWISTLGVFSKTQFHLRASKPTVSQVNFSFSWRVCFKVREETMWRRSLFQILCSASEPSLGDYVTKILWKAVTRTAHAYVWEFESGQKSHINI